MSLNKSTRQKKLIADLVEFIRTKERNKKLPEHGDLKVSSFCQKLIEHFIQQWNNVLLNLKGNIKDKFQARKVKSETNYSNKDIIDLKVSDVERVSICDFGLATKTYDKIPKGGTAAFLSPLSFNEGFKVSQDRFSIAIMCLQILWDGKLADGKS